MNEGIDASGNSIGQPASFFVGAAANPMAPVDMEMKVTRRKLEAGADFLLTQPVFDVEAAAEFLKAVKRFKIPVILGIMPLHSHRHAEFIHHELAGVALPDAVRERMRLAGENGLAEGMAIARELLEQVRDKVAGVCSDAIVRTVRRRRGAGGIDPTIVLAESGKGGRGLPASAFLVGAHRVRPYARSPSANAPGDVRSLPEKRP